MKTAKMLIMILILVELSFLSYLGVQYLLQQNKVSELADETPPLQDFLQLLSQHENQQISIAGWYKTPEGCNVIIQMYSRNGREYYQSRSFVKVNTEYGYDWYWHFVGDYYRVP